MICKWCGNVLDSAERKCRRCGREVPPLSDCGGFYDLVGGAKPGIRPEAGAAPVQVDLTGVQEEIKRSSGRNTKHLNQLRLTMLGCFVLVLALLIVLMIQVGVLNGRIGELEEMIPELHASEAEEPEEDDRTEPEDPTPETATEDPQSSETDPQEEAPAAKNEDVTVAFDGRNEAQTSCSNSAWSVTAAAQTDPDADTVVSTVTLVNADGQMVGRAEITRSGPLDGRTFTVKLEWDETILGETAEQKYEWEFRSTGIDWRAVPNAGNLDTACYNWFTLQLDGDNMEVRCVITRTAADGSIMTLTIEGLEG